MTYDVMGPGALDYLPCRYGTSKLLFRGPRRDLDRPYVAFVGGTETYGKFIQDPYPALTETRLGMTCANFGFPNAGIDAFANDPFVVQACNDAEVTVVQVMGAQNMTNRFYSVHPRRNDRFVSASALLSTIYREVDFPDFHFNKHMLSHLLKVSPERFIAVRAELQQAWTARMKLLLGQIRGKTLLLWLADHAPHPETRQEGFDLGSDPLFITQQMMEHVAEFATETQIVVSSKQTAAKGTEGMIFGEMEELAASEMLGTAAHAEAAEVVADRLQTML
tara:strand:- start:4910 stop:5743 length:834 start_codon:yes stop_codon:yes gene_type:complete